MSIQRVTAARVLSVLGSAALAAVASAQTPVLTRSYDSARTGVNLNERVLTPRKVGSNLMIKLFSLDLVGDDPRLEAQPLYVPKVAMSDGKAHDVVYVCTMGNNVWAFDASTGRPIWERPVSLGPPIKPSPAPTRASRARRRSTCGA